MAYDKPARSAVEWQGKQTLCRRPKGLPDDTRRTQRPAQLAARLDLSRARIVQLEHAETQDAVTLRTLKDAAEALGCEFVYAIVPKGNGSLKNIIETRAQQLAKERVARVAHSMSLEDQSVNAQALKVRVEEQTKMLLSHLNKKLWAEAPATKKKK